MPVSFFAKYQAESGFRQKKILFWQNTEFSPESTAKTPETMGKVPKKCGKYAAEKHDVPPVNTVQRHKYVDRL